LDNDLNIWKNFYLFTIFIIFRAKRYLNEKHGKARKNFLKK